jgi:transposase-like protein
MKTLTQFVEGSPKDGNYRNGYGSKIVKMDDGEIEVNTPRERDQGHLMKK